MGFRHFNGGISEYQNWKIEMELLKIACEPLLYLQFITESTLFLRKKQHSKLLNRHRGTVFNSLFGSNNRIHVEQFVDFTIKPYNHGILSTDNKCSSPFVPVHLINVLHFANHKLIYMCICHNDVQ